MLWGGGKRASEQASEQASERAIARIGRGWGIAEEGEPSGLGTLVRRRGGGGGDNVQCRGCVWRFGGPAGGCCCPGGGVGGAGGRRGGGLSQVSQETGRQLEQGATQARTVRNAGSCCAAARLAKGKKNDLRRSGPAKPSKGTQARALSRPCWPVQRLDSRQFPPRSKLHRRVQR